MTAGKVDAAAPPEDQSDRWRQVHEELRHSETARGQLAARQAAILKALPAHVALLDNQGVILSVNEAWRRFTGAKALQGPDYGIGQNYLELCDRAQGDGSAEAHQAAAGIREVLRGAAKEFALDYSCGSAAEPRWFRLTAAPLEEDGSGGAVVMHVDISERVQLEERLRQSQKMEVLGRLADGVAHDFNNILMVIQGYSSLLLAGENLRPETREALTEIYAAGERAANLTRQLAAFSRKQEMCRQTLEVNAVIGNVAQMLRRLLGEDITLHLDYGTSLPLIQADAGLLEQLLLTLAAHAREAMPKGGQLHLHTARVVIDDEQVRQHRESRPGEFVCLSVRDTGGGSAPEMLPRRFEPCLTTKKPGQGTGLGLATVWGIVQQHEGWVEVASQPGAGTTFNVFIPALPHQTAAAPPPRAPAQPAKGNETILLVEDDATVRGLAVLVLQRCGYRVLEAVSGVEALKVWKRHQPRIELLLTDMVLPDDMTGQELAEKLRADQPGLKVIYSSGYSNDLIDQVFEGKEQIHFLQKPYHPQKLAEAVRQVLDDTCPETR